jgi:hypothetical protein
LADGRILKPGGVVLERRKAGSSVEESGRIANQRRTANGGVVASGRIAEERFGANRRILVPIVLFASASSPRKLLTFVRSQPS